MPFLIRPLQRSEHPLLEDFLYEAVFQEEGHPPLPKDIVRLPELRCYVEHFGEKEGDVALCAEVDGAVAGVAWVRRMRAFGHVDDETPELAMAVHAPYRRQGIGSALLKALLAHLQRTGRPGVSLSVQKRNPASVMYRRLGFGIVRENGEEYVMERRFRPAQDASAAEENNHELL